MPSLHSPAPKRYLAPALLALAWNAALVAAIAAVIAWPSEDPGAHATSMAPVELLRASEAPTLPEEQEDPPTDEEALTYVPTLETQDDTAPEAPTAVAAVDQRVDEETVARRSTGEFADSEPVSERVARPAPASQGDSEAVAAAELGAPALTRRPQAATAREQPDGPELRQPESSFESPVDAVAVPARPMGLSDGREQAPASPSLDLRAFGADAVAAQQFVASTTVRPPESVAVEDGDRTMLNTQRVAYWSFFERLRRALQNVWDPNRAWRASDPGFDRLERQEYVTIIDIALRTDGMMEQLEVYRSSGSEVLDREAIRALDAIVPVRNVPEGLVSADGRAYIRYYFSFDARGGGSSLRWLRRD